LLRNAKATQKVFNAIYRGKKRSKTIEEISKATSFTPKRVASIAGPLAHGEKLFEQGRERHGGRKTTVYKKIPFVARNREQILALANSKSRAERYHTKTNPNVNVRISKGQKITVKVPFRVRSKFIRADDIKEFSKSRKINSIDGLKTARLRSKYPVTESVRG
jgi:hypothetical protein